MAPAALPGCGWCKIKRKILKSLHVILDFVQMSETMPLNDRHAGSNAPFLPLYTT